MIKEAAFTKKCYGKESFRVKGRVHSIESFGTVDGPGIRLVVFLQGCPMRCIYCHNPDTWAAVGSKELEPVEIINEYLRNRAFYRGGGITVSGGEPLMQIEFVTELFALARERGIHTALDTSGILFSGEGRMRELLDGLLSVTDLVMLDIKHTDPEAHERLTGRAIAPVLGFLELVSRKGIDLWVRRVVVKGYTDDPDELYSLGRLIGVIPSLKGLDVLPYHSLGEMKYRELGIDYPLLGMPSLGKAEASAAREAILRGISDARAKNKITK